MRQQKRYVKVILLVGAVFGIGGAGLQARTQKPVSSPSTAMTLPSWGIKTNLLYDATATINLGVEVRTGRHFSLSLEGNYNAWTLRNNTKWRHILVQPEFRWWPRRTFDGHFLGLHGHWALYNVGGLPRPMFSKSMNTNRFEGWLAGAGISYGYRWNFSHRWALEATVGVGSAHLDYKRYECGHCGSFIESKKRHYIGPTKAGLTLIFGLGGKKGSKGSQGKYSGATETAGVSGATGTGGAKGVVGTPDVWRAAGVGGALVGAGDSVAPPTAASESLIAQHALPANGEGEMTNVNSEAGSVDPTNNTINNTTSHTGSAYLTFRAGGTDLIVSYGANATELQRIHTLLQEIRNNPRATITAIVITGHASPEGSHAKNARLSLGRAQVLAGCIQTVSEIPASAFTVRGEGEDWLALESLVAASDIPLKTLALDLVRAREYNPDTREARLKAANKGSIHRQLATEFYPHLRRVDYTIIYTVQPF